MPFFSLCFGFFNFFFFFIPSDAKEVDDRFTKIAFWGGRGKCVCVCVCLCACFTHPRAGCSSIHQQVRVPRTKHWNFILEIRTYCSLALRYYWWCFHDREILSLLLPVSSGLFTQFIDSRPFVHHLSTSLNRPVCLSLWELCDFVRSVTTQQHASIDTQVFSFFLFCRR